MAEEVTDPDVLAQLNKKEEVTDPEVLRQLNGEAAAPAPSPKTPGTLEKGYNALKEGAKAVTSSAYAKEAVGGAAGALALPVGLVAGGAVLEATGVGAPIGIAMQAAGMAMAETQFATVGSAALAALGGAAVGVGGEAAASGAKSLGAGPAWQEGARLAGGLGVGLGEELLIAAPKAIQNAWKFAKGLVGMGKEVSVPTAVRQASEALAKPELQNQPQHALHNVVAKGVEANTKNADAQAQEILKGKTLAETPENIKASLAQAEKVKAAARAHAKALDEATGGKIRTAPGILKLSTPELAKVGSGRLPTEIGKDMSGAAERTKTALEKNLEQTDAPLRAERDQIVAQKEATGQYITDTPGMQALIKDIEKKTVTGLGELEAKTAEITDPGTKAAYMDVLKAVKPQVVNGKSVPPTMGAIDQVRRRLEDKVYDRVAEGYGAIGANLRRDLGRQLASIEEEYVGANAKGENAQKVLQDNYAAGKLELKKYQERMGKWLLSDDKTPAGMPAAFFKDKESVQDLRALTGDPAVVDRAGEDYLRNKLQGMNSKQVKAFLEEPKNRDWMREIPQLTEKGTTYLKELQKIEMNMETRSGQVPKLLKAREGVATAREAGAAEVRKQAQTLAKDMIAGKSPVADVEALFRGPVKNFETLGKFLAGEPGGREIYYNNVASFFGRMSPKELEATYRERGQEILRSPDVLTEKQISTIKEGIERILKAADPKIKPKLVANLVRTVAAQGTGGADRVRQEAPTAVLEKVKGEWQLHNK